MIIGIFHAGDLDGVCSGALMRLKYPDAILIPYDYGRPLYHIEQIPDGSTVIMADVSLPNKEMIKLAKRTQLTFVDHHAQKIESLIGQSTLINQVAWVDGAAILCVCDPSRAACEIVMDFLKLREVLSRAAEITVLNLAIYDLWDRKDLSNWNKQIKPFQYGMRGRVGLNVDWMVRHLNNTTLNECETIVDDGKMILNYQAIQDQIAIEKGAYECTMVVLGKRYPAIAINALNINSDSFTGADLRQKIIVQYGFQDGNWKISMRSNGAANLADLCAVLGGGGHANAAGTVMQHATFAKGQSWSARFRNGKGQPTLELV